MEISNQKEEFSFAYVHAVASAAGCTVGYYKVDSDSVDCLIKSPYRYKTRWSPEINVQLKCSESVVENNGHVSFQLKGKNYRELQGDHYKGQPRILVVVCVPSDVNYWIQHNHQEMVLRHNGYWVSLKDEEERPTSSAVTVKLPTANQFTVEELKSIMRKIGDEGDL